MEPKRLTAAESNPQNNPNHPLIRCVDGTSVDGTWTSVPEEARAPYRVFDILNQEHVGPEFATRAEADVYMQELGGSHA